MNHGFTLPAEQIVLIAKRLDLIDLPRDMPSADVYWHSKWNSLNYLYKLRLIKLFYKVFSGEAPAALPSHVLTHTF